MGFDVNLRKDSRFLTRMLDALPLIQTKEMSSIQLTAEYAKLIPAVNDKRIGGNAMIDDFESTRNINDLTRQPTRWRPGSTPESFQGSAVNYDYNYKRGKISVYTVDQTTYFSGGFGAGVLPENVTMPKQAITFTKKHLPQLRFLQVRSLPAFNSSIPLNILILVISLLKEGFIILVQILIMMVFYQIQNKILVRLCVELRPIMTLKMPILNT